MASAGGWNAKRAARRRRDEWTAQTPQLVARLEGGQTAKAYAALEAMCDPVVRRLGRSGIGGWRGLNCAGLGELLAVLGLGQSSLEHFLECKRYRDLLFPDDGSGLLDAPSVEAFLEPLLAHFATFDGVVPTEDQFVRPLENLSVLVPAQRGSVDRVPERTTLALGEALDAAQDGTFTRADYVAAMFQSSGRAASSGSAGEQDVSALVGHGALQRAHDAPKRLLMGRLREHLKRDVPPRTGGVRASHLAAAMAVVGVEWWPNREELAALQGLLWLPHKPALGVEEFLSVMEAVVAFQLVSASAPSGLVELQALPLLIEVFSDHTPPTMEQTADAVLPWLNAQQLGRVSRLEWVRLSLNYKFQCWLVELQATPYLVAAPSEGNEGSQGVE